MSSFALVSIMGSRLIDLNSLVGDRSRCLGLTYMHLVCVGSGVVPGGHGMHDGRIVPGGHLGGGGAGGGVGQFNYQILE
jgi:hypothetical protein